MVMEANLNRKKPRITESDYGKFDAENKILTVSSAFGRPEGKSKVETIAELTAKMDEKKSRIIHINAIWRYAAAVVLLALCVYAYFSYGTIEEVVTQMAKTENIELPDGSSVVLNADSKLSWNRKHFSEKRELVFNGEAFFDVEKGTNFTIETRNGKVEVLGTELNVLSRKEIFKVSCLSGKVRVSSGGDEYILLPGESCALNDGELKKWKNKIIEDELGWRNGVFHFEKQPLVVIFEELERQFDVKINFRGNASRRIKATVTNHDLTQALDIICIPMGLKYEFEKEDRIQIFEEEK